MAAAAASVAPASAQDVADTTHETEPETALRCRGGRFPRRRAVRALPALFSGPSTGVGFGASLLTIASPVCDTITRPTQLGLVVLYTVKSQIDIIAQLDAWSRGNRTRTWVQLEAQRFPTAFFGAGNNDPFAQEENFNLDAITAQGRFQRRITGSFYASVGGMVRASRITGLSPALLAAGDTLFGITGSETTYLEGILSSDTRDNILSPRRGHWVQFRLQAAVPLLTSR